MHLLAVRDGDQGPELLLSRRAGDVYASGLWHAPSGHVELETVVDAVVRETLEETGLVVEAADVRAAVTVHHRPPATGHRAVRRGSGSSSRSAAGAAPSGSWRRTSATRSVGSRSTGSRSRWSPTAEPESMPTGPARRSRCTSRNPAMRSPTTRQPTG
nr:NUDIX domain-containing protein [Streptomyces sp. C]